jgi:hypothetical protein
MVFIHGRQQGRSKEVSCCTGKQKEYNLGLFCEKMYLLGAF